MSQELAVMFGLTALPFVLYKLLEEFQKAQDMETQAFLTMTGLFVIGMQYTGHGIATSNSLSNASDAYLVSLIVTVLFFLYLMVKLVQVYWRETRDDTEFGYFDHGGR